MMRLPDDVRIELETLYEYGRATLEAVHGSVHAQYRAGAAEATVAHMGRNLRKILVEDRKETEREAKEHKMEKMAREVNRLIYQSALTIPTNWDTARRVSEYPNERRHGTVTGRLTPDEARESERMPNGYAIHQGLPTVAVERAQLAYHFANRGFADREADCS